MKKIKSILNFIMKIAAFAVFTYVCVFSDIPVKTGNCFRKIIEEKSNVYEEYNNDFKINNLTISLNTYYYDKLTQGQKKIYEAIANGVKNYQTEFVVRDYIALDKENFSQEVSRAIEAFTNDHPEVFYLQTHYSSYVLPSFNGNYGYVKLNYTEEDVEIIKEKIIQMEEIVAGYVKGTENMSEFEKEVELHDRLSYDVKYLRVDDMPRWGHTAEGSLLKKEGVCDSFSKALQLIYGKAGIDSIIVLGKLGDGPHAWNMVRIDDEWYHVDLTSSHSIYDETGIVNHGYFNLNTESLKKFSTLDNENLIPNSTSNDYNYYVHNDLVISENDNLNERLSDICEKFKDKEYIEFYLEGVVGDRMSSVLTALKNIENTFISGTKLYYYNIENAIIIPKN